MTGVEILNVEEVAVAWAGWNWNAFLLVVGLAFFISIVFGVIGGVTEDWHIGIIVFLLIFLIGGGLFGTIIGVSTGEPTKYETQYKVIIDDTVSLVDFTDKYEILDQEGKIFVVKEKTND